MEIAIVDTEHLSVYDNKQNLGDYENYGNIVKNMITLIAIVMATFLVVLLLSQARPVSTRNVSTQSKQAPRAYEEVYIHDFNHLENGNTEYSLKDWQVGNESD